MGFVDLGQLGTNSNKTSGTTLAITNSSGAVIPAGTLLVLALTFDNHASTTASTLSPSAAGGAAWTQRGTTTGSGVTTTAGSGIWGAVFTTKTTSDIASGATITTVTFGSAVVGKIGSIFGYSGLTDTMRGTVGSGTSTAGTPSAATAGTALVAGDVVIGTIHGENNATPTGDSDTLNGTWGAIAGGATTGGAANTNIAVGVQEKEVTATGVQTYNATTANDSIAFVLSLIPAPTTTANIDLTATSTLTADGTRIIPPQITQAGYRFYDNNPEATSNPLAAQSTAYSQASDALTNIQVRFLIQSTGGGDVDSASDWTLQYEVNGSGTWSTVVTGPVFPVPSGLIDGAATTNRMTGGTGTFQAGEQGASNPTITDLGLTQGNYTELVYGLGVNGVLNSTGLVDGDVVRFRVTCAGVAFTYTEPAVLNIVRARPVLNAYQWFADGTPSGSVALAAQDTPYSIDLSGGDVNLLLRVRAQETSGLVPAASSNWQLQYEKNSSGTWNSIPSTLAHASNSSFASLGTSGLPSGMGQSFIGDGGQLVKAAFQMYRTGTPPVGNGLVARLYAHTGTYGTGSVGTGAPLATSTTVVDPTTLPTGSTSYVWTEFTFPAGTTLTNGTPYVIAVYWDASGGNSSNCPNVRTDGNLGHGGNRSTVSDAGVWTYQGSSDMTHRVTTTNNTTPPVDWFNSANLTDMASFSTARLTGGTGTFSSGRVSEDGVVEGIALPVSNHTEFLYAITIRQSGFANGDTIKFRLDRDNNATVDLTSTPTITVGTPRPKIETLTDTFDSALDKTTKWKSSSAAVVWDASGRAKIPSTTSYYALATDTAGEYNLNGSAVYAKVTPPTVSTGRETFMEVIRGGTSNDKLSLYLSGTSINGRRTIGGANSNQSANVTYSPTNHAWWRIRESGGTVYFDTSPDGNTWTNLHSTAPGWDTSDVYLSINSGWWGSEANSDCFVDYVNTPEGPLVVQGAAALTATSTLTATAVVTEFASVAMTAVSTLTATGTITGGVVSAAASLTATSTLTATGTSATKVGAIGYPKFGDMGINPSATTVLNVPYPTGEKAPDANDYMLLVLFQNSVTLAAVPSGWTDIFSSDTGSATTPEVRVYSKTATGSEAGNVAVATPSATSQGFIVAVPGVDLTNPLDVAVQMFERTSALATFPLPSYSVGTAGATLLGVVAQNSTGGVLTPPSASWFKQFDGNTITPHGFAAFLQDVAAGATGTLTFTLSTSARGLVAVVTLRPGSVQGAAGLIATSTLTVTGVVTEFATASMTAVSTLTADAVRVPVAAASLTATSTLTATATTAAIVQGAVNLTANSTLTATATRAQAASAALTATSTLTATAVRTPIAAASLVAVSTLTATAVRTAPATVALTAASTLTVSGVVTEFASIPMTAVSTLTATAVRTAVVSASLVAASTLTVAGIRMPVASVALTATSTLTATAGRTAAVSAALTSTSTLTATAAGIGVVQATANLVAASTLSATAVRTPLAAASLVAASTLTATAVRQANVSTSLNAVSTLTATASKTKVAVANLTGTSSLAVNGTIVPPTGASVSLVATATLTVTAVKTKHANADLFGTSTLVVGAVKVQTANANLTAGSTLTASAVRMPVGAASLIAESMLVAEATIVVNAVVNMEGVATLTAAAASIHFSELVTNVGLDGTLHAQDDEGQWQPVEVVGG